MSPAEITAIVLAAGAATRMGKNKLLMQYGNETMLTAVLRLVAFCGFRETILVISKNTLGGLEVPPGVAVIINHAPQAGQGLSVALGAAASAPQTCGLMFFQGDMPLLNKATVLKIVSAFDGQHIAVPEAEGQGKSPVVFPLALKEELIALRGDEGGRSLIRKYPEKCLRIPFTHAAPFRDIDTSLDYNELTNPFK